MHRTLRWNCILLTLFAFATGAAKAGGLQADLDLFAGIGISAWLTRLIGVLQVGAAPLLWRRATGRWAAWYLAVTFAVATAAVFNAGMSAFGSISLLFIAMAVVAAVRPALDPARVTS